MKEKDDTVGISHNEEDKAEQSSKNSIFGLRRT